MKITPRDPAKPDLGTFSLPDGHLPEHHAEHVLRLAKQLADGNRAGILATVGIDGQPRMRWMATLSLNQFPHLYALTSPKSQKVTEIRKNPKVSWLFTSETSTMVVNLSGKAKVVTEPSEVNRVWQLIENKSNAYFMALNTDCDGIAVIDTIVEDIDCVIPQYGLHYPPRKDGHRTPPSRGL